MKTLLVFCTAVLLFGGSAKAEPPPIGSVLHAGTSGIFCLKDVAAEVYGGLTKASEVKPRLDAQMANDTCAIIEIPVDGVISEQAKVGEILTDFSAHPETDDVWSFKITLQNGSSLWALWAETQPPSI